MTESSASHDKAGLAKANVHDSVATCCVETEEARARDRPSQARAIDQVMGARQRCAHDKRILSRQRAEATRNFMCDKTFPCRDKEMCRLWKLGRDTKILSCDRVQSW